MQDDRSLSKNTFDLSSQVGVLQALYAVRRSELQAAEKNSLRDQIFTYTKSGGDAVLRQQVEQQLANLPLSEEYLKKSPQKQQEEPESGGFTGRRKSPQFSVPEVPDHFSPDAVHTQTSKPPRKPAPVEPATAPAQPTTPVKPAAEPAPTAATQQAAITPAVPQTEDNAIEPTSSQPVDRPTSAETTPASTQSATPAEPAPEPTPVTQPNSAPAASTQSTSDNSINRIRVIKSHINNKIGNPVNLVDIDNTRGREYMSALLRAMQSVNAETGQAGALEMESLEKAFSAVLPLLDTATASSPNTDNAAQHTAPTNPQPPSKPTSAQHTAPDPESTNPAATTPSVATPVASVAPETPNVPPVQSSNSKPNPQARTVPINTEYSELRSEGSRNTYTTEPKTTSPIANSSPLPDVPQTNATKTEPQPKHAVPIRTEVSKSTQPSATPDKPVPETPKPDTRKPKKNFNILPISTETSVSSDVSKKRHPRPPEAKDIHTPTSSASTAPNASENRWVSTQTSSLKDEVTDNSLDKQLETLDEQGEANKYKGDPLHAPEIDAGLEQLLQEWSLFKSSGLFGSGPNGREHPLYKKLAPMMVQEVAMGEFEDARPEIVQSITDYMNGWRYEQGVVYEPGETFEEYLRRVIKFILTGKP